MVLGSVDLRSCFLRKSWYLATFFDDMVMLLSNYRSRRFGFLGMVGSILGGPLPESRELSL